MVEWLEAAPLAQVYMPELPLEYGVPSVVDAQSRKDIHPIQLLHVLSRPLDDPIACYTGANISLTLILQKIYPRDFDNRKVINTCYSIHYSFIRYQSPFHGRLGEEYMCLVRLIPYPRALPLLI